MPRREPHPADVRDAERAARATLFAVHFMKGPLDRYRETATSLSDARAIAERLNHEHGRFGRRAIIYALVDGVSIPIS